MKEVLIGVSMAVAAAMLLPTVAQTGAPAIEVSAQTAPSTLLR